MSSYDLLARHARNVLLMQTKFCENATLAAVLTHRTSLIRNVRNLFKKVRQFLRNSLTNFFDEFSYNANGLF